MKILILSHYFIPHPGGIEIIAYNQAKELVKKGHNVTVITSNVSNEKNREKIEGITVIRIKAWNWFEKYFNIPFPLFSLNIFSTLSKEIKKTDIVHIHDIFYISSILPAIYAYLYKKSLYITQHVTIVSYPIKIIEYIQQFVYATFGKLIFKKSKKIITYNSQITEFLIKLGVDKDKIVELQNGVNLKKFVPVKKKEKILLRKKYGIPFDKKVVLFLSRLAPKKGSDILFKAKDNKYLILFVGSGPISAQMNNIKNVKFLGQVALNETHEIYKLSDIFVLPTTGEVFPLVIQEAMACGLPIITTHNNGYNKFNINNKLISFSQRTPSAIKKNILKILTEKSLFREMNKYSLYLSKKYFDWNKNINGLLAVYVEKI